MHQTLHVGALTVIETFADRTPYGVVLEDDGEVAYFYGLDTRRGDRAVVDSLYLYCVSDLEQHPREDLKIEVPCDVEIVWSADQERVALLMNGRAEACLRLCRQAGVLPQQFPGRIRVES
jgi:hypothetical protein